MDTQKNPASDAGGDGAQPLNETAAQMSALAEDARTKVNAAARSAKKQARRVAEQQKAAGAEQISGIARAVDSAAEGLEKQMPQAAGYIHTVADKLEATASAVRDRSVDDLVQSARDFASKQPAAFFAGAVLAGFALSRFLVSSSDRSQSSSGKSEG